MQKKIQSKFKFRARPSRWLLKPYIYTLMFLYTMTVLLVFLLLAEIKFLNPKQLHFLNTSVPRYLFEILIVTSVVNIYFLLNVLRNKRWGFWGYCISGGLGSVFLNLYWRHNFAHAILGIGAAMFLYLLLRVGGSRSAWNEMK